MPGKTRWLGPALLALCGGCPREIPESERLSIERVHRDLLASEPLPFEVVTERADERVRAEVITPTEYALEGGSDRLSLLMSPPAEVVWRVGKGDGPAFLRTAAGVDMTLPRGLARKGLGPLSIRFEILQGERVVYDEIVVTDPQLARDYAQRSAHPHAWYPVGGEQGIAVEPGDVLRFRTSLLEPLPAELAPPRAGFAELLLVRPEVRRRARASREHPNVLLVVMDTLRRDRTSLHGYERRTTPRLEELAARGTVYDSAWSTASWTWPATASLLTGLEPEAHGVTSPRSCHLVHELRTLAEALQEEGYACAAFSGNPLVSPGRGFDQGFEHFVESTDFRKSEAFVPEAMRWIDEHREQAFFAYLHLVEPHTPHSPPPDILRELTGWTQPLEAPDFGDQAVVALQSTKDVTPAGEVRTERLFREEQLRWLSDVYDAEIAAGDQWLGRLLGLLDDLALRESTIVVFVSDHGEELLDHGWLSHAHTLYPELLRVPLVLAGPGIPSGKRCATPVSTRHLAPTLARLAGARLPAAGDALRLDQPDSLPERPIFFDTRKGRWNGRQYVDIYGLLEGGWVLQLSPPGQKASPCPVAIDGPPVRLYAQQDDPGQVHDRAPAEPERVRRMQGTIESHLLELGAQRPARRIGAGAATKRMLEHSGYGGGEEDESEH